MLAGALLSFALCFAGVFFGLVGLFGLALAHEMPGAPRRPKWAVACGVGGILGGFFVGLFGLVT